MNSWQQPKANEPGGATWHPIADPGTGWFATKTSWSGTDNFSSHGFTVDFSSVVPKGTVAVWVNVVETEATNIGIFWRPYNDSDINNNPQSAGEQSHVFKQYPGSQHQKLFWLNDLKMEVTTEDTDVDLYISYPFAYLL
jgi:hypothetical protein